MKIVFILKLDLKLDSPGNLGLGLLDTGIMGREHDTGIKNK